MAVTSQEFKSMHEFLNYLNEAQTNDRFLGSRLASRDTDREFYKTSNFQEAVDLAKNGWNVVAAQIETKLKLMANQVETKTTTRSRYDVAGFQASVPRYLQGNPMSMVNQSKAVQKQKVITIVKHIGYLGHIKSNDIIEYSTRALQIVKKVEAQGYRVNLDIISPVEDRRGNTIICRVRIKNASERLNVAKVAFPLVHPSMLRRLVFSFRETHPQITPTTWQITDMGITIQNVDVVKKLLNPGEYYLHNVINDVDEAIKQMQLK